MRKKIAMQHDDELPVIKKVIQRMTRFDWLPGKHAARGREVILHGASFLIAMVLLVAGYGQLTAHPLWSALALALFGCGYCLACYLFDETLYVYSTLALWTFAFFLVCSAAGVPPRYFPVVATLLIWILWIAAGAIGRKYPGFTQAIYRCVFITTVFFGLWAMFYQSEHREVPAMAFLLYGVSTGIFHFFRPRSLYGYCSGIYLALGSFYAAAASQLLSWQHYGIVVQVMVFAILLVGVLEHGRGRYASAKPHYQTGMLITFVCLIISLAGLRSLLDQLALMALSLGFPSLLLIWMSGGKDSTSTEDTYPKLLYFLSQASLYAALPFILVTPLVSLGHALWASLLLTVLSLCSIVEKIARRPSGGIAGNWHQLAFLTAVSGAWLGASVSSNVVPNPLGLAITALLWIVVWVYVRKRNLSGHSSCAADCQATLAAALVLIGVFGNRWDQTACIAGAIVLACSFAVLLIERRLLTGIAVGVAGSFLVAAVTGVRYAPVYHWSILEVLGYSGLMVALFFQKKEREASISSATALALAVIAMATALNVPGHERSLLCLAGALGIPVSLAALFYRQKKIGAMVAVAAINIVGLAIVLWVGRLVSPVWLGSAILVLVPFLGIGWFVSGLWAYAMTTAAALAVGLLLPVSSLFGLNWEFMLVAAVLCALFLHADFVIRDALCTSSVAAVGHTTALLIIVVLYMLSGSVIGWKTLWSLIIVGGTYLSVSRHSPGSRSTAYFFFSLTLLPLTAAFFSSLSAQALSVSALLVPAWSLVGLARRDNTVERTQCCKASSFLGLILCFIGATRVSSGSGPLFVLCLFGFLVCLLITRERFYVHLIVLLLALMGYSWIRQFGSHFTQELYRYLLVILGLATIAELSPYLVRYLDQAVPLPYVRLVTWRGVGMGTIVGIVIALICTSGFSLAITFHPSFCKSCHNMGSFFESWQHSSHKDVACIECHYEPGVAAHVKGKIGALSQLVAFVTHSYGARPHAEVSNESCQRSGCHAAIEKNTDVLFKEKVHFNHSIHLEAMVPGRSLPCTSCHSQELQTEHIGISSSTCFLCHFYGQGAAAQKTMECTACHGPPEEAITIGGATFSHLDFFEGRGNVDCHDCHRIVNAGDARVSSVRCQSCHYGDKLGTLDGTPVDKVHERHVHDQKVKCFECHDILRHGVTTKATAEDARMCNSCHIDKQHSLQARMYLGTAVPDIPGTPNVMFEVGISCNHCHRQQKELVLGEREFVTHVATGEYCVNCHGDDDYKDLIDMWQDDTKQSMETLQVSLDEVHERLSGVATSDERKSEIDAARRRLSRAEELHAVIKRDGSQGVHNIEYIGEIIEAVNKEIEETKQALDALKE